MAFLHVQCCSAHWIWYDSFIASRKSSGSWALLVSASCSVGVLVSCTSRRHAGNSLVDLSGIQWHQVFEVLTCAILGRCSLQLLKGG